MGQATEFAAACSIFPSTLKAIIAPAGKRVDKASEWQRIETKTSKAARVRETHTEQDAIWADLVRVEQPSALICSQRSRKFKLGRSVRLSMQSLLHVCILCQSASVSYVCMYVRTQTRR